VIGVVSETSIPAVKLEKGAKYLDLNPQFKYLSIPDVTIKEIKEY
jgi:hypothetical protein